MGRFSHVERLEEAAESPHRRRIAELLRFLDGRPDVDEKLVFTFQKPVDRKDVLDEHVVRAAGQLPVQENIGEAVQAFEYKLGVQAGHLSGGERASIPDVRALAAGERRDVHSEERLGDDAVAVQVELEVARHSAGQQRAACRIEV